MAEYCISGDIEPGQESCLNIFAMGVLSWHCNRYATAIMSLSIAGIHYEQILCQNRRYNSLLG